jgi:hypothetical protein
MPLTGGAQFLQLDIGWRGLHHRMSMGMGLHYNSRKLPSFQDWRGQLVESMVVDGIYLYHTHKGRLHCIIHTICICDRTVL